MCFGANFWHHANLSLLQPQKNGVGDRPKERKREAKGRKAYTGVDMRTRRKGEKWAIWKCMSKRKGTEKRGERRQKENLVAEVQRRKAIQ